MAYFHVWFSTKNRKWLLQGDIAEAVMRLIRETAVSKSIALMECESVFDHVHLLIESASRENLSTSMQLLKGRSSYEVFRSAPDLKTDGATNSLWQRGFSSREVPAKEVPVVARYIRTQDERLEKFER
jgi:putative transposase